MLLLKTQKNDVFNIIKNHGLDPLNFRWEKTKSNLSKGFVSCLWYKDAPYYFEFDMLIMLIGDKHEVRYRARYCPGEEKEPVKVQTCYNWEAVSYNVKKWLMSLQKEIEGPDLWEQVSKYAPKELVTLQDERGNEPFSDPELKSIRVSIDNLKIKIEQNFSLNPEQMDYVKERLDYIADKAEKFGRHDWLLFFLGCIFTIASYLTFPKEQAGLLWKLVKECFTGILAIGS